MSWWADEFLSSSLIPRKVRFLTMTMLEQARHCSFGLTKTLIGYALLGL